MDPAAVACCRCRPCPKQPSEEAFFLLFLLVGRGRGRSRLGRSRCRLRAHRRRRQRRHSVGRGRGSDGGLLANAKKLLEHIALIAGALVAGLRGRGSVEKNGIVILWATGVREQVGHFIQPHGRDPVGSSELAGIGILRQLNRMLHELRPDRAPLLCHLPASDPYSRHSLSTPRRAGCW